MAEIDVAVARPGETELDVLAVAVPEPATRLPKAAAALDERLDARLSALVEAGEISGRRDTATVVHSETDGARRVAVAGLGPEVDVDADSLRTAAAAVARRAKEFGGTIGWILDETLPLPPAEQMRAVVEGVLLGAYDPGRWKTMPREERRIGRLVLVTEDAELGQAAERAQRVAAWTNRARDLSNMPPNELTPARLAETAEEIAGEDEHLSAEWLGPEEIHQQGMGALAAVAQGSHNPPRLIVMRYDPPGATGDTVLGLVGKAITFDTGGISLKPGQGMEDMKHDMSGGGAVVAAMGALAELETPVRTIAVVAATENMPGGGAYRPGDIITAMNGKTIEVINTDAEGRLVLADALWCARQQGATHLLDLATLTGAMVIALGDQYAGVFANDEPWRDLIVEAGEESGEHIWPFPMHPRWRRYVDSDYADMKNASMYRQAGSALAAAFLQEFAGEGPWAHADIPGPAFLSRSRGDYLTQRGGTGYGVRLIVELASRIA